MKSVLLIKTVVINVPAGLPSLQEVCTVIYILLGHALQINSVTKTIMFLQTIIATCLSFGVYIGFISFNCAQSVCYLVRSWRTEYTALIME